MKKAVVQYCKENGFEFLSMGYEGGKTHGKIRIKAKEKVVTVGWSGSSKAGTETTCRMVVDHLKRKVRKL